MADEKQEPLPVTYDANGHVTKIEVPAVALDPRNTVIAVQYEGPIVADPDAKGEYHWYTKRSRRHTEIQNNKRAGQL